MNTADEIFDPRYWDCNCPDGHPYQHLKSVMDCPFCGAHQDDAPDSLICELKELLPGYTCA